MNFRLIGWFSVALAALAILPFLVRVTNQKVFKSRSKTYFKVFKILRATHKVAGLLLAVVSLVHGFMALNGRVRLHTGTLVHLGFLVTAILGIIYYRKKNRTLFRVHKTAALVSYLLLGLHLLQPWALGQWFGLW